MKKNSRQQRAQDGCHFLTDLHISQTFMEKRKAIRFLGLQGLQFKTIWVKLG
jgi:hypothetical protein